MLENIARYIFNKIDLDYDKLRQFINSIEVYSDQDDVVHIHFKQPSSFEADLRAPTIQLNDLNKQSEDNASE